MPGLIGAVFKFSAADITVPPQSTATNAAIRMVAATYAQRAASGAANALHNAFAVPAGDCTAAESLAYPASAPSIAEQLASLYADAHHVFFEAIDGAVTDTAAAADEARSAPSPELAAARAEAGRLFSRSAAARLLVGGAGLPPNSSDGFCPMASPSPATLRAAELIRASGIDPTYIIWPQVSTGALLEGPGGVKERLFSLWDRAGEAAATTLTADTGVGEDAFDAARTLLAREF
ncbi:MAG: hypothetical protein FJ104_17665, partial [Deltaproteobacteria bacterium]|nr:hypothetical protein [Deltaproteobacteria bacterium]